MQVGSGGAVHPLPPPGAGPGQSHAGGPGKFVFMAQKAIDWLVIYSFFMYNLVLSEEYLYKYELVK